MLIPVCDLNGESDDAFFTFSVVAGTRKCLIQRTTFSCNYMLCSENGNGIQQWCKNSNSRDGRKQCEQKRLQSSEYNWLLDKNVFIRIDNVSFKSSEKTIQYGPYMAPKNEHHQLHVIVILCFLWTDMQCTCEFFLHNFHFEMISKSYYIV